MSAQSYKKRLLEYKGEKILHSIGYAEWSVSFRDDVPVIEAGFTGKSVYKAYSFLRRLLALDGLELQENINDGGYSRITVSGRRNCKTLIDWIIGYDVPLARTVFSDLFGHYTDFAKIFPEQHTQIIALQGQLNHESAGGAEQAEAESAKVIETEQRSEPSSGTPKQLSFFDAMPSFRLRIKPGIDANTEPSDSRGK
jgi:hypothetical protein